jgi:hypothetical protein
VRNFLVRSILAGAAVLAWAATPAAAQSTAKIPRTADGKPDFSGVWQSGGVSLYGEIAGNNRQTAAVPRPARGRGRGGFVRPAPPSYKPETMAKVKELAATSATSDPTVHCLLPGVPRIFGMPMPFEIIQTPKQVAILYESFHGWRLIPFGAKHNDPDPSFLGDSVARWDGDTLVVDVIGFNGKIWLDGGGHYTTDQLHVVERYTLNGDTISYEATAMDPGVMTQPWTQHLTFTRLKPGERPLEYECLENNQDLPHLETAIKK